MLIHVLLSSIDISMVIEEKTLHITYGTLKKIRSVIFNSKIVPAETDQMVNKFFEVLT